MNFQTILKRLAIAMLITPVLFLTYHKGVAEYITWLWPTASITGQAGWAFFSLLGAFVSGLIVAFNWKD